MTATARLTAIAIYLRRTPTECGQRLRHLQRLAAENRVAKKRKIDSSVAPGPTGAYSGEPPPPQQQQEYQQHQQEVQQHQEQDLPRATVTAEALQGQQARDLPEPELGPPQQQDEHQQHHPLDGGASDDAEDQCGGRFGGREVDGRRYEVGAKVFAKDFPGDAYRLHTGEIEILEYHSQLKNERGVRWPDGTLTEVNQSRLALLARQPSHSCPGGEQGVPTRTDANGTSEPMSSTDGPVVPTTAASTTTAHRAATASVSKNTFDEAFWSSPDTRDYPMWEACAELAYQEPENPAFVPEDVVPEVYFKTMPIYRLRFETLEYAYRLKTGSDTLPAPAKLVSTILSPPFKLF